AFIGVGESAGGYAARRTAYRPRARAGRKSEPPRLRLHLSGASATTTYTRRNGRSPLCSGGGTASLTGSRAPPRRGLIVDPFLFEAGETVALARHLDPAGEEARRREQQPVFEVGRVVAVLLEGGDRDLLVVRIVLEAAGAQGHRFH